MNPWYEDDNATVWHGDCLDVLREMPDASVDSIVTDPPYGLGFMGKAWDDLPPGLPWAQECLRVLKPGGHLLAFGGTRTWHRLACAVEDAGFEVRDSIAWLYGSGFPKSLDVSKAIDKAAGAEREVVGFDRSKWRDDTNHSYEAYESGTVAGSARIDYAKKAQVTAPATPAAQQWQGWGTALKPAFEPVVVARKPLGAGTVAANVLAHGTGALNVDGCRVATDEKITNHARSSASAVSKGIYGDSAGQETHQTAGQSLGRWPTNVVLDGDAAAELDEQSGEGGASRFFPVFRYQAKAPTRERPSYVKDDGDTHAYITMRGKKVRTCNQCGSRSQPGNWVPGDERPWPACGHGDWSYQDARPEAAPQPGKVSHPTVKPLTLMRWLVRLVTPPGGVVLDPFAGSGTTVEAAILEGFQVIGIEREVDYLPLIEARIARNRVTAEGLPEVADALALFDIEEPA